jgi:hypothetical protein
MKAPIEPAPPGDASRSVFAWAYREYWEKMGFRKASIPEA